MPSPLKVLSQSIKSSLPTTKIDRVILFGSAAEGDLNQVGDIDVAILLKKTPDPETVKGVVQERADELSGDFFGTVGKRIEPLVFSKQDWEQIRNKPLGISISKGKELYPHADL